MQTMQHLGPDVLFPISSTPFPHQQRTGGQMADFQNAMLIYMPLQVDTALITLPLTFFGFVLQLLMYNKRYLF